MAWNQKIVEKLAARRDLPLDELVEEFELAPVVTSDVLRDCLTVFEQEYQVHMGKLRPTDPMETFVSPPATANPVKWLFDRAAIEDKTSELSYALKRHRKAMGLPPKLEGTIETLRDYVEAWCGLR